MNTMSIGDQRLAAHDKNLRNFDTEKLRAVDHIYTFNMSHWHWGTAACAFGMACLMPEFQEQGLRLVTSRDGDYWPEYRDRWGYGAATEFFDIEWKDSLHFFFPPFYAEVVGINQHGNAKAQDITPLMVADRIAEYLHAKGSAA